MKVLFVHDGPIFKDVLGNYYGLHLNDELRKRYLHLGDHVTFLIRVYEIQVDEIKKYGKISNDRFSVISVPICSLIFSTSSSLKVVFPLIFG